MPKQKTPHGPIVKVFVTKERMTTAIRSHSGHCMIADAIRDAVPGATKVAVDISTCRFSDPVKGLRYVYLTPRVAQDALVDFDEGITPQEFSFLLRRAHVSRAGSYPKRIAARAAAKAAKAKTPAPKGLTAKSLPARSELRAEGNVIRRVGGKRPPQLHVRREFGIRAFRAASFRRLAAEQPIETE